jgi:hypothetical protein
MFNPRRRHEADKLGEDDEKSRPTRQGSGCAANDLDQGRLEESTDQPVDP